MSDIAPINRPTPAALNGLTKKVRAEQPSDRPDRQADSVELSQQARLLSKLQELPDIREGLVNSVKAEIQAGTYETAERLDAAINSLLEDLV